MEENKSLNLMQKKQIILDIIKKEGPCLPSAITSKINLSLLLASALLSELRAEKKLRISTLKIGGSPLYYLEGQEVQLENFIKHLPKKEQETFELLKKHEVVDEEKLEPAHRVALRYIKDFAFPIQVRTGSGEKIFWRLHSIKSEDASKRISEILKPKQMEKSGQKKLETTVQKEQKPKPEQKPEKPEKPEKIAREKKETKSRISKSKKAKDDFKEKIYTWLRTKNLHVEKELDEEYGDDAFCTISANSSLGRLSFMVVAKSKKRINDADISLAYQQGQQAKMPVLLLTSGQLTKKAQIYLEQLGKFIVVNSL